jgi:hypothetical protein
VTVRQPESRTARLAREHKRAGGARLTPGELARELVLELVDKYDDDRTTAALLERVAELVEPGSAAPRDPDGKPAKVGSAAHSPSPVADGPLHLLTDVHAGVRDLELTARRARGFGTWPRGDSPANTLAALHALPDLLDGLDPAATVVGDALRSLRSWHSRARDLIGTLQRWTPLRGHVCPYCECASLRQRPRDGALVCITPTCSSAPPGEPQVRPEWLFAEYAREQLTSSDEASA